MNGYVAHLVEFSKGRATQSPQHERRIRDVLADMEDTIRMARITCIRAAELSVKRKLVLEDWEEIDFLCEQILEILAGKYEPNALDRRA